MVGSSWNHPSRLSLLTGIWHNKSDNRIVFSRNLVLRASVLINRTISPLSVWQNRNSHSMNDSVTTTRDIAAFPMFSLISRQAIVDYRRQEQDWRILVNTLIVISYRSIHFLFHQKQQENFDILPSFRVFLSQNVHGSSSFSLYHEYIGNEDYEWYLRIEHRTATS